MSRPQALSSPSSRDAHSGESGPIAKPSPRELAPPTLIGRYALFGQIGAGGMGIVHLGRLLGSAGFERAVAIKRVHPMLAQDHKFITMFREELRLLARVRHQNVISALDVVEAEEELLLVMEYVHGESLASLLQRSREAGQTIPLELAVTIACGVLKGLHAAHMATNAAGEPLGIIHRDVSPHNVLIGCDGFARVVDFGVARSVGSRRMTRVGELRGKPGYVAPEQIRGDNVSCRSDIYAASVVLWEMLACQRLFSGRSLPETIEDVLAGNIPSLESATKRSFPKSIEAIILKGLDKDPQARFATAREMALALEGEVKLVPVEQVGEWVEKTAHASIAERARQLTWAETCPIGEVDATEVTRIAPEVEPSPEPEPATKIYRAFEGGEIMTREMPLAVLPPIGGTLGRPQPAPLAAPAEPVNKSGTRSLLVGAAAVVTLLLGANIASQGALLSGLTGARPAPTRAPYGTVTEQPAPAENPEPNAPKDRDVRAQPMAAPPGTPTIAVSALPMQQPAQRTSTAKPKPASDLPPSAKANPYAGKTAPAPAAAAAPAAKRAPTKSKALSQDGF